MAFTLPNGAVMSIAANFGPVTPVTAVSNANPAVATAEAHDLVIGNVVVVTSGWTRLNDKVARIAKADEGTFELLGIDTSREAVYTPGAGAGSVRAVSAWAQLSQITEVATSGGDQQFTTFGFLEEDDDRQMPTTKSPISMTITVADDPAQAYVPVCEAADEAKETRVVRLILPNGSVIYYNAYISISATPTLSRNNVMTRAITLSLASRPTRYQVV
ncbi:phage tail protein [Pseudomonas sp. NPDC087358]|uniref:phage tail protein n=1 Tax=Pseudomonas sp. NPDC087358 TaxID=3364439 RepID=UPI00384F2E1B